MTRLIVTALLAFFLVGCGGQAVATVEPTGSSDLPTPTPSSAATEAVVEATTTPEPTAGEPTTYKPGDVIEITSDGAPWATIVVSEVKAVASYKGSYYTDKPAAGNVYIQAKITYTAKTNGVSYNPFDWQVFVGGVAVDNYTTVLNGPTPELGSGDLPSGRVASGYVVYEVAKVGEVLLSYGGSSFTNDAPVFEVVLRSK